MEDTEFWVLVGLLAAVIGFGFLAAFLYWLHGFRGELRYLNNEIGRTGGSAQRYWRRQRRRLWLSVIPFVRYRNDE